MANEKQEYPWWKRILLTLIIIAMVLLGVSMLARYVVTWQLGSEITKIAKANEPLGFSDLKQPATTENAADYYTGALAKINLNISQDISRANLLYRNTMISSENGQVPKELDTQITPILAPLSSTFRTRSARCTSATCQGLGVHRRPSGATSKCSTAMPSW